MLVQHTSCGLFLFLFVPESIEAISSKGKKIEKVSMVANGMFPVFCRSKQNFSFLNIDLWLENK